MKDFKESKALVSMANSIDINIDFLIDNRSVFSEKEIEALRKAGTFNISNEYFHFNQICVMSNLIKLGLPLVTILSRMDSFINSRLNEFGNSYMLVNQNPFNGYNDGGATVLPNQYNSSGFGENRSMFSSQFNHQSFGETAPRFQAQNQYTPQNNAHVSFQPQEYNTNYGGFNQPASYVNTLQKLRIPLYSLVAEMANEIDDSFEQSFYLFSRLSYLSLMYSDLGDTGEIANFAMSIPLYDTEYMSIKIGYRSRIKTEYLKQKSPYDLSFKEIYISEYTGACDTLKTQYANIKSMSAGDTGSEKEINV